MSLADQAEGRTISISIHLRLVPPRADRLGHTDAAMAIAAQIVDGIVDGIRQSGITEGFDVTIEPQRLVY